MLNIWKNGLRMMYVCLYGGKSLVKPKLATLHLGAEWRWDGSSEFEAPTLAVRLTPIKAFFGEPHMGQFLQDGKNVRLTSFFLKVEGSCGQTW